MNEKERFCGECPFFTHEDCLGAGICTHYSLPKMCDTPACAEHFRPFSGDDEGNVA
jgi:hypothetical protein